jgi:hypothetical protein
MMAPRNFEFRSTGPKTEAGKQIVSKNSTTHGLTAKGSAALAGLIKSSIRYTAWMKRVQLRFV